MKTFIFIGPTINETQAKEYLDATYLPPVAQGDVAGLLRFNPDVIGIIDGYFDQAPSVWHKEILLALSQGVRVFGASSMGALRAAELYPFGMLGIGQIFEWYRDGYIDADDEVALQHAPAEQGYLALSEAMVNIRKTLLNACEHNIIAEVTLEALIGICKATPYGERSYRSLLAKGTRAGLKEADLSRLEAYVTSQAVDQKKADAIALLQHLAALDENSKPTPNFPLQKTVFLNAFLDRDIRPAYPDSSERITFDQLVDFARLESADFREQMQRASARSLHIRCAKEAGIRVSESEFEIEWKTFRSGENLKTDEDLKDWLDHNFTSEEELRIYLRDSALEKKILKIFASPNNNNLLWQMRMNGGLERWFQSLQNRESKISMNVNSPQTNSDDLLEFYNAQNKHKTYNSFNQIMEQLRFRNKAGLLIEMQKYYHHHAHTQSE